FGRASLVSSNAADLERAAALIRAGKLVAFPTETVYGLGANALDADAVERIFIAKGRPRTSPLIVHVDSVEMAQNLVRRWPDAAETLARRYWPGPLSLVGAPLLLRPGVIPLSEIEAMIGPVAIAAEPQSGAHAAPGMHLRHYRPRTPLYLLRADDRPPEGRGAWLRLGKEMPREPLAY